MRTPSRVLVLPLLFLTTVGLLGCDGGPSSSSPPDDDVRLDYGGSFDGDEVVLERIVNGPDGGIIAVDLVAREIEFDEESGLVSMGVALRNQSRRPIGTPATVYAGAFNPEGTALINSDNQLIDLANGESGPPSGPYPNWFDYSATFGDDGVLSPNETSAPRRWVVAVTGDGSFSFGAALRAGSDPDVATISGHVFVDANRSGTFDDDERTFSGGQVVLTGPGGASRTTRVTEDGSWRVNVERVGAYSALWTPPPTFAPSFAPLCMTTPNPAQIVIVAGADAQPRSLAGIDFGFVNGPCPPAPGDDVVRLTDAPPDSIPTDSYALLGARVIASPGAPDGGTTWFVEVRVGFSGCSGDHPFRAFAGADFMDTNPPSTWLRLSHDDRGELCEAWFEETRVFDLSEVVTNYWRIYGDDAPPNFTMEITGPRGQSFQLTVP